jgi:hypothetical protein
MSIDENELRKKILAHWQPSAIARLAEAAEKSWRRLDSHN